MYMSYQQYLSKDLILRPVIKEIGTLPLITPSLDVYKDLLETIVSQQLSVRVADVIWKRFESLFDNNYPGMQEVVDMPIERMREVGLSNAKAQYIKNIAQYWIDHKLNQEIVSSLPDSELSPLLLAIKWVWPWTVEMMLMFSLGREDVFSVGDLGIQTAMIWLYDLSWSNTKAIKERMLEISNQRKPYRSYACRYLRKWKDMKK